jgi:Rps23 Pro-64 3,4-dihydroxylase Tpa1-like proline 4-hydroxylase
VKIEPVTRTALSRERFSSAKPFPHLVLDGFLDARFARALAAEFPRYDFRRFRDAFGRRAKASYPDLAALGPAFRRLEALAGSRAFLRKLERLTGIAGLLHSRDRYPGAAHEYLAGMSLRPHLDFNVLAGKGWHRRLNLVLFLTPEWRTGGGGEVVLGGRIPLRRRRAVAPLFNRCLLFATGENSWHSLRALRVPRRSVSLYFYTASPPAGAARPRLTLWDFPPLPRSARAGARLSGRLWARLEESFLLRDLELLRGEPGERRRRPSPLDGRLSPGGVQTPGDAEWLSKELAARDRALERKWNYTDRLLDEAIARFSKRGRP